VNGYRRGFVLGLLSFAGIIGGGVLGLLLAPGIARWIQSLGSGSDRTRVIIAIASVLFFMGLGHLVATRIGLAVRRHLTWRPVRVVDSAGGAVLSGTAFLLVAWFLGTAVVNSPFPALANQVGQSRILAGVDRVLPSSSQTWFSDFRKSIIASGFPQVFGALGGERVAPVPPPDAALLNSPGVVAARSSVVKIVGVASSCERRLEGSGFVIAPNRVMTNAHVVAGVDSAKVQQAGGGRQLPAVVVLFDPQRDVAVLQVPGLKATPLKWAGPASSGDGAVVAGYPEDGPYSATPARIRSVEEPVGLDIYGRRQAARQVYSLRALVQPGNSGGPVLAPDGSVYGVVFAKSTSSANTAYALTAAEVRGDAEAAASATEPVSTMGCT
jgi:S1-C subfamily serine protease